MNVFIIIGALVMIVVIGALFYVLLWLMTSPFVLFEKQSILNKIRMDKEISTDARRLLHRRIPKGLSVSPNMYLAVIEDPKTPMTLLNKIYKRSTSKNPGKKLGLDEGNESSIQEIVDSIISRREWVIQFIANSKGSRMTTQDLRNLDDELLYELLGEEKVDA